MLIYIADEFSRSQAFTNTDTLPIGDIAHEVNSNHILNINFNEVFYLLLFLQLAGFGV